MEVLKSKKKEIFLIALFYGINFGLWELLAPFVTEAWASFLVYLLLFFLVIVLFHKELKEAHRRWWQKETKGFKLILGFLFWLVLYLLVGAALLWLAETLHIDILPQNSENVKDQIATIPIALAILQGCVFAPVIEEMTFRYAMIQRSKNRSIYGFSVAASILLFDWIHVFRFAEFFYYLLPAVVLTAFYLKHRNVWASILFHSLINTVGYIALIGGAL